MIILLLCGTVVLLLLINNLISKNSRRWKYLQEFPGKPTLPFIGNGHQLGMDPAEVQNNFLKMWEECGRTNFRVVLGPEPIIMVCQPNDLEKILGNPDIIEKPKMYDVAKIVFGDSIFFSTGHRWRTMRKLMSMSVHFRVLEKYTDIMVRNSHRLVEKLRPRVNTGSVDIAPYVRNFALDTICATTMGVDLNAQNDPNQPYVIAEERMVQLLTRRWFSFWKRIDFLYHFSSDYKELKYVMKSMHDTSQQMIDQRRKCMKDILKQNESESSSEEAILELANKGYHYFIDLMLLSKMADGSPIPNDIIREELDVLMFAGSDTTNSTVAFLLYNLAKYPKTQEKAFQEQLSIFHDDYKRDPTTRDINEMKYLEKCIKESLRLYPTAPQYGRHISHDMKLEDGKVIPAGTSVMVFLMGLYSNPELFPEPHVYNPDRFLEQMHPFAHLPFAAGPRSCLGVKYAWMEMKILMSIILRNYELSSEPHMEPHVSYGLVIRSMNGLNIILKERIRP